MKSVGFFMSRTVNWEGEEVKEEKEIKKEK